jgi:protease I
MRVLIAIPSDDFDPTEAAVPWKILSEAGVEVVVATPEGEPAQADPIVLGGERLGWFRVLLRADANGRAAYEEFSSAVCSVPSSYADLDTGEFDALILPGGHAPKMRAYLESEPLRAIIGEFFASDKLVAAICHGVVAVARTKGPDGKSVLYGRKTTALTEAMELFAWKRTRSFLGDYYRTYPKTVQREVTEALANEDDFLCGPRPFLRDTPDKPKRGFIVEDGNYISARYPGDVHRFANAILVRLEKNRSKIG